MKKRGVLIAGNWKMNLGVLETSQYFEKLKDQWNMALNERSRQEFQKRTLKAALFPAMLSLEKARTLGNPMNVAVGAQNVHWEKSGAFTGEVSGPMIREMGIELALVGHSERRQYFGETNETARKRTESLLEQGIQVMLCIGETRAERESGKTQDVLYQQLKGVFPQANQGAASYLDGRLILAYEPVWAIGTGLTATPEQAEEAHQLIRQFLSQQFGDPAAVATPVLYGGSVSPKNIDSLLTCSNIDGALVGGASLKPESFLALLEAGGRALSG